MDVAHQRGLQVFGADELVALQHFLDASVEAFDHAVGLRMHRRGETVLDAQIVAKPVKVVFARGRALAQTEQPIGELFPVFGQDVCRASTTLSLPDYHLGRF